VDLHLDPRRIPQEQNDCRFLLQDLSSLAFADDSFSLLYSYHVLEHVQDPEQVLKELHRVLRPGGVLFIGFPNRHRLFSYFGTSQDASFKEKIIWNWNDYRKRLAGQFENRLGAHAGFSEKEFILLSSQFFHCTIPVRNQYMLLKYQSIAESIKLMMITRAAEFLFPSNYFVCQKKG
jgi:ubiquinone/menaquinone biosynthesis C-methylase UbiE